MSTTFQMSHPSVWKCIDKIRDQQKATDTKVEELNAGAPAPRPRPAYAGVNARLRTIVDRYNNTPIAMYLRGIAHNFSL